MLRLLFLFLSLSFCNAAFAKTQPGKGYLDVSITVFDSNVPADKQTQSESNIYPDVRKTEAIYIPAFLQLKLMDSNMWGAVRLLPSDDIGAEILIKGKIIRSDGSTLVLKISATDSTGRIWINKVYSGRAVKRYSATQSIEGTEPFLSLYEEITQDLANVYAKLSSNDIKKIKAVALLRYAAFMSPEIYKSYLSKDKDGHYVINHLPASNDPDFMRIKEIRRHEFLFIDVVNQEYHDYMVKIKPVYDLWRKYRREQQAADAYIMERKEEGNKYSRGSYMALRQAYDNFRLANMKGTFLNDISSRFNTETKPTNIKLKDSLYHLTGTLDDQYAKWRGILKKIYKLEK